MARCPHRHHAATRPADISPSELRDWRNEFLESEEVPAYVREDAHLSKYFEELWIAGNWLGRELRVLGLTEEQIKNAGFVAGQRCHMRDPWAAHKEVLRNCKEGKFEEPGFDLADKIVQEQVENGTIAMEGDSIRLRMRRD